MGILTGAVLDEQNKALGGATVQLLSFRDTFNSKTVLTGANGDFEMKTWSTDPPKDYDAPNPGTAMVGFEMKIPANTKKSFRVFLIPESSGLKAGQIAEKWSFE